MIDSHIHTNFSSDSDMLPETACEKAITRGLTGLIFTDHLDIDYPGFEHLELINLKRYFEYIDILKIKYNEKLLLLKGIEAGIQPGAIEKTAKLVRSYDFDYVIASVHIVDGIDPYFNREYYSGKTIKEAYEIFLTRILYSIVNYNDFDNVGHFEYVTRYASYDDRTLRYDNHSDLFDLILKQIIEKGKGFEINTGSFRDKPGIPAVQFDSNILKRYRELGGELISLGSDAHNTEYIGYKFDYFRDMLIDTGFSYITHYEKRKPVYTKLT